MKNNRKSFKEITGVALAIVGLLLAIGTVDGSENELLWRMAGIVLLGIGVYVARMFDFQTEKGGRP